MLKKIKVGEIKKLTDYYTDPVETISLFKNLPRQKDIPLRLKISENIETTGEIIKFEKGPTKILGEYEFSLLELSNALAEENDDEVLDWLTIE